MVKKISEPVDEPLENQNFLSPNKFILVIDKFPAMNFLAQRIALPTVSIGTVPVFTNRPVDYTHIGDKVVFEDIIVSFIVDEDLKGYKEIIHWLWSSADSELDPAFSDFKIICLTNNSNKNKIIRVYNSFPYLVSNILLDTTVGEDIPLTVDVNFKYSHFDIE